MSAALGLGTQHLIEFCQCRAEALEQVADVEAAMRAAAAAIGATILSGHFHQFEPNGVSGVLVISESHFAVHTWPEHGYASLDLFTCGDRRLDPAAGLAVLLDMWGGEVSGQQTVVRGPAPSKAATHE